MPKTVTKEDNAENLKKSLKNNELPRIQIRDIGKIDKNKKLEEIQKTLAAKEFKEFIVTVEDRGIIKGGKALVVKDENGKKLFSIKIEGSLKKGETDSHVTLAPEIDPDMKSTQLNKESYIALMAKAASMIQINNRQKFNLKVSESSAETTIRSLKTHVKSPIFTQNTKDDFNKIFFKIGEEETKQAIELALRSTAKQTAAPGVAKMDTPFSSTKVSAAPATSRTITPPPIVDEPPPPPPLEDVPPPPPSIAPVAMKAPTSTTSSPPLIAPKPVRPTAAPASARPGTPISPRVPSPPRTPSPPPIEMRELPRIQIRNIGPIDKDEKLRKIRITLEQNNFKVKIEDRGMLKGGKILLVEDSNGKILCSIKVHSEGKSSHVTFVPEVDKDMSRTFSTDKLHIDNMAKAASLIHQGNEKFNLKFSEKIPKKDSEEFAKTAIKSLLADPKHTKSDFVEDIKDDFRFKETFDEVEKEIMNMDFVEKSVRPRIAREAPNPKNKLDESNLGVEQPSPTVLHDFGKKSPPPPPPDKQPKSSTPRLSGSNKDD